MKRADFEWVKSKTNSLPSEEIFIDYIKDEDEHAKAQTLMDEMIEIYLEYKRLIQTISVSLMRFEESGDDFREFYMRLDALGHNAANIDGSKKPRHS